MNENGRVVVVPALGGVSELIGVLDDGETPLRNAHRRRAQRGEVHKIAGAQRTEIIRAPPSVARTFTSQITFT